MASPATSEDQRRRDQRVERAESDLVPADRLAEELRRPPDHEAGDEHGDDRDDERAVEAGADPARRDLAEHHVEQDDATAERAVALVHGVDRAGGGARRGRGEQGGGPDAEPDLLALHRPGAQARPRPTVVSGHRRAPEDGHEGEDRVPWRRSPTMIPYARGSANGMTSSRKISKRLVRAFGFSNGCAELALKKPPPLVPSSLIASWRGDQTARDRLRRRRSSGDVVGCGEVLDDPAERSGRRPRRPRSAAGRERRPRVRSTQKLPTYRLWCRAMARMRAATTAMPTAAEAKFWTVRPTAWTSYRRAGLTGIRLPVRVGDEGDGGVEGGVDVHRLAVVQRQPALGEDHEEQQQEAHHREGPDARPRRRSTAAPGRGSRPRAGRRVVRRASAGRW